MLAFLGLVVGVINGVLFTIAIKKNLFEIEPVYPIPILSLYIAGVFIISIIALGSFQDIKHLRLHQVKLYDTLVEAK